MIIQGVPFNPFLLPPQVLTILQTYQAFPDSVFTPLGMCVCCPRPLDHTIIINMWPSSLNFSPCISPFAFTHSKRICS